MHQVRNATTEVAQAADQLDEPRSNHSVRKFQSRSIDGPCLIDSRASSFMALGASLVVADSVGNRKTKAPSVEARAPARNVACLGRPGATSRLRPLMAAFARRCG